MRFDVYVICINMKKNNSNEIQIMIKMNKTQTQEVDFIIIIDEML